MKKGLILFCMVFILLLSIGPTFAVSDAQTYGGTPETADSTSAMTLQQNESPTGAELRGIKPT